MAWGVQPVAVPEGMQEVCAGSRGGETVSRKKNMRRLNTLVTAQTMYHLQRLADMDGNRNVGRVIDKLVRDRCQRLKRIETILEEAGEDDPNCD